MSVLNFLQSAIGAIPRAAADKIGDMISVKDFGAVGDGVADDTAALQLAATCGVAVYFPRPSVAYRTTAPITTTSATPLQWRGEGVLPFISIDYGVSHNMRGGGSWLHFDHSGKGIVVATGNSVTSNSCAGSYIVGMGSFRSQPLPGTSAFTPGAFDWDIDCSANDLMLRDFCFLNPTKALKFVGTNGGQRLRLENVIGQPLTKGLYIDNATDTQYVDVRWYPYWSLNGNLIAWQIANATAVQTYRIDGASYFSLFGYGYNTLWQISSSGGAPLDSLNFVTVNFLNADNCVHGVAYDSNVKGSVLYIKSYLAFGYGNQGVGGIELNGTNNEIYANQCSFWSYQYNCITVAGTGNKLQLDSPRFNSWNLAGSSFSAINIAAGNAVVIDGSTAVLNQGTNSFKSGGGSLSMSLGCGFKTTATSGGGIGSIAVSLPIKPNIVFLGLKNTNGNYAINLLDGNTGPAAIGFRVYDNTNTPVNTSFDVLWDAKYQD